MRSNRLPEYCDWLIENQRDLEIQDPAWYEVLDGDWRSLARNIRSMLNGYQGRMGIHAPFLSLTLAAEDPRIRAVVSDRFKQSLDFCAEVGATHMVIHSPFNFLGTPFAPFASKMPDYRRIIHDTLAETVAYAEQIQCTLMIENIFDRDPKLLVELVKSFDSANVRMSVDTGHAYINHKLSAPPPDYWIREAGNLLGHVHIQDTDGYADRHWSPGHGSIAWETVFEALSRLEHEPRLILELMDQSTIRQAAKWFQERGLAK
jgi:sugar phosphate isomerase/epimerase